MFLHTRIARSTVKYRYLHSCTQDSLDNTNIHVLSCTQESPYTPGVHVSLCTQYSHATTGVPVYVSLAHKIHSTPHIYINPIRSAHPSLPSHWSTSYRISASDWLRLRASAVRFFKTLENTSTSAVVRRPTKRKAVRRASSVH